MRREKPETIASKNVQMLMEIRHPVGGYLSHCGGNAKWSSRFATDDF